MAQPGTKNQRAFKKLLDEANERLAGGKRKVRINLPSLSHRTLFLRATLPPRPGEPPRGNTQQRIQIPCEASATGLIEAEKLAIQLHADITAWKVSGQQFDWGAWTDLKPRPRSDERESLSSVIERFEKHWRKAQGKGDPQKPWSTDRYWQADFQTAFNRLDQKKPYSFNALVDSVEETEPKSRVRRRQARACRLLAEFQGESAEDCRKLSTLGKGYGVRELDPRDIPSDKELLKVVDMVPDRFRWSFRALYLFGVRPHELHEATCDGELFLAVNQGKTGARDCVPVPSERHLPQQWDMAGSHVPKTIGQRSKNPPRAVQDELNRQLNLLGITWDAYVFRHAWAHRSIREGYPTAKAAMSMGNSEAVFKSHYARWIKKESLREALAA